VPHTISYAFPPAATGTWYLYVKGNSDNSFSETNINNNISSAVAIAVSPGSPVDLIVSDFTLADTVLTSHAQLLVIQLSTMGPILPVEAGLTVYL
jgi:subtilase family serine protease